MHRVLAADPAGAYARMDFESRDRYRGAVAALARHSGRTEREVAEAALELAREAHAHQDGSRAALRRSHVGYYLMDRRAAAAQNAHRLPATFGEHAPADFVLRWPTAFYLIGIELLTFCTVALLLSRTGHLTPLTGGLLLLLLPATQAAVDFMNHLVTALLPPRALPKLDFSEGVPADCATMVAVPSLLLNEAQVRDLVLDLEIRFLANRDPNLYFALLTDTPDSDRPMDERDALVAVCRRADRGAEPPLSGSRPSSSSTAIAPTTIGGPLDGLGAQARQAARPQPAPARRLRRLPGEGGRLSTCCRASATSSRWIPTRSFRAIAPPGWSAPWRIR